MMILEDFYLGRSFGRSGQGDRPGLKFTWTWTWEHEREKLMGECPDGPGHSIFGTNLPFWTLDIGDTELALEL